MLRLTVLCLTILTFINLFSQTHVIEEVPEFKQTMQQCRIHC